MLSDHIRRGESFFSGLSLRSGATNSSIFGSVHFFPAAPCSKIPIDAV